MNNNIYQFMLRTGKYLPDEDIKFDDGFWYFEQFNEHGKQSLYEDSDGYWYKQEYNENGDFTYYENSDGYWQRTTFDSDYVYYEDSTGDWHKKDFNGTVIESGNHNDKCI